MSDHMSHPSGWRAAVRTVTTAGRLGWRIESNWTDPLLFAVYSVIRPLSGAAILVVMFAIISGGDFSAPYYSAMYLGNAFYTFVSTLLTGISWAVADDRERYKTLKYVYITPIRFPLYLIGRSFARVAIGSAAVAVTLIAGVVFLHVSVPLGTIDWGLFTATFALGVVMLGAFGLLLAGISMLLVHHSEYLGDTVSGAMYLFSGAVFPLNILPAVLRPIGYVLPLPYWFELLRRALLGPGASSFPGFAERSTGSMLGVFILYTAAFCGVALLGFRACERRARERGLLDWISNY